MCGILKILDRDSKQQSSMKAGELQLKAPVLVQWQVLACTRPSPHLNSATIIVAEIKSMCIHNFVMNENESCKAEDAGATSYEAMRTT